MSHQTILHHSDESTRVAEAFDSISTIFDSDFENLITRSLRTRVYHKIQSLIPSGSTILDVNCGTGIDAIYLSSKGYPVLGIDISPRMIDQACGKLNVSRRADVHFKVGSFDNLSKLTSDRYDLVLSNFGGLNCTDDLKHVAKEVAAITKPNGFFIAVIMPPVCLWEIVVGLLRLNWKFAFRRLGKNSLATGFRGKTFSVTYHPLQKFVAAFRQWFDVQEIRGYNIFSPPPHATQFKNAYPQLSRWLEQIDDVVAHLPLLRSMGDHYLVVLRKKPF